MVKKIILICVFFQLAGCEKTDINAQVANDFEQQYHMAKRNGASPIDLCVHSGFAAAGYLQSKDEANYSRWKKIEKSDCLAAGIDK